MSSSLAVALAAGVLAAFNPCGFALLPGYLALFLGTDRSRSSAISRALVVGASVTVGFLLVFGLAGVLVSAFSVTLGDWLSLVTLVTGLVLIAAGVAFLAGLNPTVRLPKAKLPVGDSVPGMVAYGIVYAVASLSCTLPVFLAAVVSVFRGGGSFAEGVGVLVAYGLGMGAVLTVLALAVALFRDAAASTMRRSSPVIGRIAGVFLLLAGAYVTWYAWVEYRAFQGDFVAGGPVDWVGDASGWVGTFVNNVGAGWVVLAAGAAMAAALVGTWLWRKRRSGRAPLSTDEMARQEAL